VLLACILDELPKGAPITLVGLKALPLFHPLERPFGNDPRRPSLRIHSGSSPIAHASAMV